MRIMFDNNERVVLLNALDLLAEDLTEDDEDQPVIAELRERIETAGETLP